MPKENLYYATGKRKNAIARTWLKPGTGEITINNRPVEDYFPIETMRTDLAAPFKLTNTIDASWRWHFRPGGGGTARHYQSAHPG
jgi:small subunit ribosomal protein S9